MASLTRSLLALAVLVAFAVPTGAASAGKRHERGAASNTTAGRSSYLVTVEGPTVYGAYADLMAAALSGVTCADSSCAAAVTLHERLRAAGVPVGRATLDARTTRAAARALGPELHAAGARAAAAQAPVAAAAARLGAQVVSHYTTGVNGLLVHATSEQARLLAATPGVSRVEAAPRLHPDLDYSVPWIGAEWLADALGYDGTGTTVAIIDTGIDYTHADFRGPGTVEAYAAAVDAPTVITDEYAGAPLFPTAKVVGGWDFVGERYNPPWLCPPEQEAAGSCTTVPEPDPDPIDRWGHGSHVAGIAAGSGSPQGNVHSGVAPGARLVGLKVYSHFPGIDEEVDVVVDAIEWCTAVNLGMAVPGTAPPEGVDAVNMSLGEDWGQGSFLFDEAVEAATGAGVTVVASAGNSGDTPFIHGAPAASPKILAVASSTTPGDAIAVDFSWDDQTQTQAASEGSGTKPLAATGVVEGPMAWFGLGCDGSERFQDPMGKVALVERGTCTLAEKVAGAQAAGAIAIVMFTDGRPRDGIGGANDGVTIPGVMIDRAPGLAFQELLVAGTTVTARLDPDRATIDYSVADAISGFSSRGPAKHGALKPNLTLPGSAIFSAGMGRGIAGTSLSGTSMSSPHGAGAAALIRHRSNEEGLALSALDVDALLMNYALPVITNTGAGGMQLGVTRQGAGRVDLARSGTAKVLVRAGDIADMKLGPVALTAGRSLAAPVTIANLGTTPKRYRISPLFHNPAAQAAVTFDAPESFQVDPESARDITVSMAVNPARLPAWPYGGYGATINAGTTSGVELDGWLRFEELDAMGEPVPEALNPALPFYVMARTASAITSPGLPPSAAGAQPLKFVNRSAYAGAADLYWHAGEDPNEADVLGDLDIRHVGVRIEPPHDTVTRTYASFAVGLWEPAPIPFDTRLEAYLDTNENGLADHRVRVGTQAALTGGGSPSNVIVGVTLWDGEANAPLGDEQFVGEATADLNSRVIAFRLLLETLGMTAPGPIDFYVARVGLTEDWLHRPGPAERDVAPDGAGGPGGTDGWYHFDASHVAWQLGSWHVDVPGLQAVTMSVTSTGGGADQGLLLVSATNDPAPADDQAVVLPADVPIPEPGSTLYIPIGLKGFELIPPGPSDVVWAAIDDLAATSKFRMTSDVTAPANPAAEALREHEFDRDTGVDVVSRQKHGADIWQIHYLNEAFLHQNGTVWSCGPMDAYLYLRPELIAKLHAEFPRTGWVEAGTAPNDPSRQFRAADEARGLSYFALLPDGPGPVTVLTWTLGDVATPTERQVYRFRAFNDPEILVGRPRGVPPCR